MREDQQKTPEDKLKLLEEQHEDELKRRRVECREKYESENEEIKKKKICSETDHSLQMNDGRHLDCAEEGVKLNLVVCGSDGTLKSSISEQILQQTDRRSDRLYVDYVARL
ncbi:GTPase IMAP family member 7-like isoform X1 [Labeo rohita]|uniref:GTPase IMAP family member 7-like isoform X1 n=1 Tax=Labeo rohita TaxID=84645 RepID=A0A498LL06_LABRO|nr:GTPase IMAP family member 7-like isoform X1 [Labeo rohita]